MAQRSVTRLTLGVGTTAVTFAEGDMPVTTFEIYGQAIATADDSIVLLTDTNYSLKTVGGFSVTVDQAVEFWAIVVSVGTATDDPDVAANAIVTLSEVKSYLSFQSGDTQHDAFLKDAINKVSSAIETQVNGKVVPQDIHEILDGDGQDIICPPSGPTLWVGIDEGVTSPLVSDGFSASTTDGLGHTEGEFVGTGGSGEAWSVRLEAFLRSGGRVYSIIDGDAIETTDALEADCIVQVKGTIDQPGSVGIVARYVDSSNYILAYHNQTSIKLDKVVAGVTTNLISETATYSAGAVIKLVCDGRALRLYYNGTQYGSSVYVSNFVSSTLFGIYASAQDGDNYLDDFAVFSLLSIVQYRDSPSDNWVNLATDYKDIQSDSWFIRIYGGVFPVGNQNILLHRKEGYISIPGVFSTVAKEAVAYMLKESRRGENMLGVSSKSISEGGASESGGLVGLSERHKKMLTPYTRF